ncbi:MAG: biosynthetic arginine decarboxylase [Fibrobacterales bacterium]
MKKWSIDQSTELYNINGWGAGYYSINELGNIAVTPYSGKASVDLSVLMQNIDDQDIASPVLLRFTDILDDRIESMYSCFKKASKEYNYTGKNHIIYPIKVNQMRPVVEELVTHGRKFNIGLEAGSKPELHAVLATNTDSESLIICNGYKDEDYIELALLAQKMGRKIFLVIEKPRELQLIIELAQRLKVKPTLGMRVKLASSGSGKWEDSGGDNSKFGLTSSELLEALELLETHEMHDCFQLIHFHIGSQVNKIRSIINAMKEAAQFYVQLKKMGHAVEYVDIGGGLGVDYDGTRSSLSDSSVNYTVQEYVNDAIYTFVDASDKNNLPHPNIITESGRSLSAHHSLLVFEVLEASSVPMWNNDTDSIIDTDHELVKELYTLHDQLISKRMMENFHDAQAIREEALDRFSLGVLDLISRAKIEKLYWSICHEVHQIISQKGRPPEEFKALSKILSDKYFCNFSLFQSLPDSWAIDHIFPIMPLQRLTEEPTRQGTIQDITCDSDGKISSYIATTNRPNYLPLHTIKQGERYYLGAFLVGAYQEILGDLHNLFGDTNAVHVSVTDSGYNIDQVIDGETVADVLDYVQFEPKKMVRTIEAWVTASVKAGNISQKEGREFIAIYSSGLYGYTYLE